ncbi:hypothetical protein V8B55DRAFT_1475433 [Mucor lusitanicus]|uniref:Uncharacterized protein n=2 Tax=Mucor circinelloides f. lusitanicus TaxID=29924 RepID=A0A168PIU0_MUCCL|nr:hypothetical protein FB192DRAFT_1375418 [Mucor lusitanicus]OAD07794.1 hypothetical protein MUCCIDRAFT_104734 [Mucor lusitanicus CBS 277.49]
MQLNIFSSLFVLFAIITAVLAADNGHYTVSGLGKRKQQILKNGGTTLELAIAMLETEDMTTKYVYGDGKTQDSANFGIFKQGWFMLRTSVAEFKKYGPSDYNKGAVLNAHLAKDIKTRQASQAHFGLDKWFAGHRNGETGINNPYTQDIQNYKDGVYWIKAQLESNKKYLSDDTRFWVYVQPI